MGLDTVELVLSVEDAFQIQIPEEWAAKIGTVGELHDFVMGELERRGRPNIDRDITYDLLRSLICLQLGTSPERVVPSARFVQDLGAG